MLTLTMPKQCCEKEKKIERQIEIG